MADLAVEQREVIASAGVRAPIPGGHESFEGGELEIHE